MKRILAVSLCIIFTLCFASSLAAAESSETNEVVDMSDIALTPQESADFNAAVADDEAFIHLVVTAAEHKGKDVSLEGVHADKGIKLYGVKGSENSVKSISDTYTETGKIENQISEDYAILVLYVKQ